MAKRVTTIKCRIQDDFVDFSYIYNNVILLLMRKKLSPDVWLGEQGNVYQSNLNNKTFYRSLELRDKADITACVHKYL